MELFAIAGDFLAVIRKELISADGILVAVRAFLQCERRGASIAYDVLFAF